METKTTIQKRKLISQLMDLINASDQFADEAATYHVSPIVGARLKDIKECNKELRGLLWRLE